MKNLLKNAIACAIVITTCFSCSVESIEEQQLLDNQIAQDPCADQDPQARITNNGTIAVTLQIATIDGTILHTVQDLAPGNTSSYLSFASGDIIFNVIKNTTGVSDNKVVFAMDQCMSYDMEIDSNNDLLPNTPVNL
ncbi:hypothetical protein [uncultured Psychroserpens sp.]|uniref:hypothetical protein n=1 Tax=uncultured Psychroserpens sp. TaxID=255436 RepID=UPI002615A66B|nr:hypothetical protein [uncultured Psychroserpens sp.]